MRAKRYLRDEEGARAIVDWAEAFSGRVDTAKYPTLFSSTGLPPHPPKTRKRSHEAKNVFRDFLATQREVKRRYRRDAIVCTVRLDTKLISSSR